jgi:hypothetical protein
MFPLWFQQKELLKILNKECSRARHREMANKDTIWMEKLPSLVVIHKRVDMMYKRLAQMEGQLTSISLECNLGFFGIGKYTASSGRWQELHICQD